MDIQKLECVLKKKQRQPEIEAKNKINKRNNLEVESSDFRKLLGIKWTEIVRNTKITSHSVLNRRDRL